MPDEERVNVRLTPEQRRIIESAAAAKGLGVSVYIRMAALDAAKADGFTPEG